MAFFIAFVALLLFSTGFAVWKGGAPERIAAGLYWTAWLATLVANPVAIPARDSDCVCVRLTASFRITFECQQFFRADRRTPSPDLPVRRKKLLEQVTELWFRARSGDFDHELADTWKELIVPEGTSQNDGVARRSPERSERRFPVNGSSLLSFETLFFISSFRDLAIDTRDLCRFGRNGCLARRPEFFGAPAVGFFLSKLRYARFPVAVFPPGDKVLIEFVEARDQDCCIKLNG